MGLGEPSAGTSTHGGGEPTVDVTGLSGAFRELALPSSVARYRILRELGRGGLGVVYLAYDPQLDRRVALKLLLERSDDPTRMRAAVLREAQAAARIAHPNVVAIYDADESEHGVYIAMEYIPGETLSQWVQSHPEASAKEIVAVYAQAGQGLAAAHARGVVHRDFKPANVLVGEDGRVRVLDFGLARTRPGDSLPLLSSQPELAGSSPGSGGHDDTLHGSEAGTPAYMAPEQVEGLDVGAAADQFALCVALWEALSGTRPFPSPRAARMLAIEEASLFEGPQASRMPRRVRNALRRGLAREPSARFADLEQLLQALAPPASRGRIALGGVAVVALFGAVLPRSSDTSDPCEGVADSIASSWNPERRSQVRDAMLGAGVEYADDVWTRVESVLDDYAEQWAGERVEACRATAVRGEQSPRLLDLRVACLDRARMELSSAVDVLADADAEVVANAHALLELPSVSRCADASVLLAEVPPPPDSEAAAVTELRRLVSRSRALAEGGRQAEARALAAEAVQAAHGVGYGPVHAEVALQQGRVLEMLGDYNASEAALRRALAAAVRAKQADAITETAARLMLVVAALQRPDEALGYRELLAGASEKSPRTLLLARSALAWVHGRRGEHEESVSLYRRALAAAETAFGPGHPRVAMLRNSVGSALGQVGRTDEAHAQYRLALREASLALGDDHPSVAAVHNNIGTLLERQDRHAESEAEHRRALAIRNRAFVEGHLDLEVSRMNLAGAIAAQGRFDEAIPLLRRVVDNERRGVGAEHPVVAAAVVELARVLARSGDRPAAVAELRDEIRRNESGGDANPAGTAALHTNLGRTLAEMGEHAEAEQELRRALAILEKAMGPDHPHVASVLARLGEVLVTRGDRDSGEATLRRALAIRQARLGPDHAKVAALRERLGAITSTAITSTAEAQP